MPRAASLCLVLSVCLAACSQRAPRPEATPLASVPVLSSVAPPPPAPASAAAPGLADAYSGTIEPDLPITMRLVAGDNRVDGRYFYDTRGADLELSGAFDAEGHLSLAETVAGKTTGTFRGTLGPAGELDGNWDGAQGGRRAFHLERIARHAGGPALIRKKWHRSRRNPKVAPLPGASILHCNLDLAYPEVFGLGDAKVEAAVNEKLRAAQLRDHSETDCATPYALEGGYAVHTNRGGVLSVSYTFDSICVQCDHSWFGGGTLDLRVDTGAVIPLEALFVPGGRAKVVPLLNAPVVARIRATAGAANEDIATLRSAYLSGDYVLEDKGLRLIAFFRLPHEVQALDGDFGVLLPWAELAPLLDPASPAARVWAP